MLLRYWIYYIQNGHNYYVIDRYYIIGCYTPQQLPPDLSCSHLLVLIR